MNLYEKYVLPKLLNCCCNNPPMVYQRKKVVPLAENNNLEILIYSSEDIVYEDFLQSSIGENTVVVGHSNTIPDFVNNLIDEGYYDKIDDLNNSNLYIVSLCNNGLTHKLITID